MESLLNLKDGETTTFVIQDILRMVTIQVFTQMLFVMNNSDVSFFNMKFLKTTIFICLTNKGFIRSSSLFIYINIT